MSSKYVAIGAVVILLLLAGFFLFGGDSYEITNYPLSSAKTGPVIAFGDSLVEGVGATAGNDFISLVSKQSGIPIENKGVSGNTTAQGVERLDRDVLSRNPRVVLVLLGGNDFLRRVSRQETFRNLDEIVRRIQEKGAVVILLGVRGGVLSDGYEAEYEALAKRRGAFYVPNVLDGLITDQDYMSDAIHPNDRGYREIAARVRPVVEKALRN